MFLFKSLLLALILRFFSTSIFLFYFFFEASLIPIFWIIVGWGYQPERLVASLIMFFYTLISSLPLLASLVLIWHNSFSMRSENLLFEMPAKISRWYAASLTLAFLVKFPMFMVHLWLPKAHVEAPVSGSIILAGVLLKLGGYGLFRLSPFFFIAPFRLLVITASLVGGGLLRIVCCRLSDIKVVIAYSSVVHMALIIFCLLSLEKLSLNGAWWVMLAHGLVSSGIFAGANVIYAQRHSRRMLLNKGILTLNPIIALFWFLLIIINFGGPFTLNLYGEINLIFRTISSSPAIIFPVIILTFFSAAYRIILYATTQQGSTANLYHCTQTINRRELGVLVGHV